MRWFLLIPALSLSVALGGTHPAHASGSGAAASPLTPASGTFTYMSSTFNSTRSAGGNTIIDLSATVAYTGTLSGTSTVNGTLIFHADGSANFHDVEVFSGTVNGIPGTVTFNLNGSSDPALNVRATDIVISAAGDLAHLHGVLSEVGNVVFPQGPKGFYTGQFQLGNP